MGYHLLVGLRGFDVAEVATQLSVYRAAWQEAGHAGSGEVLLRIPVYVAATATQARAEPELSTMRSYRRLAGTFADSAGKAGTTAAEERLARAKRLASVTYDDLLRDRLAYGTPDMVAERLGQLRDTLGLSGVLIEPNVGGHIPLPLVVQSVRLFAREVLAKLQ
jgi:alkanesulfonate monooxygenase SsuD/methylene tetrahydromethanopterin reductase-like flavin-dependent oxidoreductase (luciferase family)